jgi:hypothetical protein
MPATHSTLRRLANLNVHVVPVRASRTSALFRALQLPDPLLPRLTR